jgi:FAD-linked oxidoreductase
MSSPLPLPRVDRRRALQGLLATAATGAALPFLSACTPSAPVGYGHGQRAGEWRNWSGSQSSRPQVFARPADEDALRDLLQAARGPVRPVGASHSFSPVVTTDGTLISVDALSGLVAHDAARQQATLRAGTSIRDAGPLLDAVGQALPNQGDVDPQTLGGAIGTATHGTGMALGSFSSMVAGLRLVTPEGEVIDCDAEHDAEVFDAARTNVGALGVVSQMRLQNRAPFRLRQREFTRPLKAVLAEIDSLREQHRHFEFFAFFHADDVLVKTLDETDAADTPEPLLQLPVDAALWLASELAHGLPNADAVLQRLLVSLSDASAERVGPSYRIFPSPREVAFNEMEYEVPVDHGPACLMEIIDTVRASQLRTLFPIEYRHVAAESAWLSPFHQQACASISIHQYWQVDHRPLFALVEPILQRHGGRPHWGKLHTLTATGLAARYPRWQDFQRVRRALDPRGKMLSPALRQWFGEVTHETA